MKILFFDTETTGLPKNWKAPVHQLDNWPRLVQIAWQVYSSNGDLLEEHDYVIKPDGFIISLEASAVHKITTEKALETGLDLFTILKVFSSSVKSCGLMVAHNYSYDYNIMGSELLRNGLENSLKDKEHICTMNASTEFCKISGPYGYKWPKLEELYKILFDESFNAHDALDDIRATAKCFWELVSLKIITLAKKNKVVAEFDLNKIDFGI
jgi:DNA polymerase III epsilon subunit-like protein